MYDKFIAIFSDAVNLSIHKEKVTYKLFVVEDVNASII